MSLNSTENGPSQTQLRAELEQMVIGDLLGPSGGKSEELTERSVRDRYLVGVLAPSRGGDSSGPDDSHATHSQAAAGIQGTAGGEDDEDESAPLIPDELAEGGSDTREDGTTDKDTPVASSYLPSSIGMTFCIDAAEPSVQVTASWGQYKREKKEDQIDPRTGNPLRVSKRYSRGGERRIVLKEGPVELQIPDADFQDIYLQGRIRKRSTHWVVTLFLVNAQVMGKPKDEFHIFQPHLTVFGIGNAPIFVKRATVGSNDDIEERLMAMMYRSQVEFAVGHGISVHVELNPEHQGRATAISTEWIPKYEVPRTSPPTEDDADTNPAFKLLDGLVLDMKLLAEADARKLPKMLEPLTVAYRQWIDGEAAKLIDPAENLAQFGDAPQYAIDLCRTTLKRIEEGLKLVLTDKQALEAFQFMNRAMWLQRTHSIYAEQVRRGAQPDFDREIDVEKNRSWRPFQIAFILLNIPGVTKLDHPDRGEGPEATADLLFFPTGGGKTEAYLGLSAYTMGLRRLQGTIAGRVGDEGVAVLMRYTLRLLTIQQFQRATALICACESIRRKALEKGDKRWGSSPFRIGLWVGRRTTPNRTDDAAEAIKQSRGNQYAGSGQGSPYQLTSCPMCGSAIDPGRHLRTYLYPQGSGRTLTFCGDKTGQCLFSERRAPDEGLPVVVVDEEIY